MYGLKTEPVLITAFVGALLFALVEFGIPLTSGQQTAVQALIAAALAWFARSQVTSEASLIAANTTSAKVMEAAGDPSKSLVMKSTAFVGTLILALGSMACSNNPNPTVTADQKVAQAARYASQAVDYVTTAQKVVNTYTVAQGGRTEVTDKISSAIRDLVIPQAERLRTAFNVYAVASNMVAQTAALRDLQTQLDMYEQLVEDVLNTNIPDGLTKQLLTTVHNIETLIDNIRESFLSGAGRTTSLERRIEKLVAADIIVS